MGLTVFKTDSKDFSLMQTSWSAKLNPILANLIMDGIFLKNIQLTTGSNIINHRLGRKLQGWFISRQRSNAGIYDNQDNNSNQVQTLILITDANVEVDLYVF